MKIEAGLTYAVLRDYCCLESLISTNKKNITLPLTVQYFLFNGKNKIQPFIGAGLQYNIDATNTTRNSQANIESLPAESSTDKKYISLLFTQGITYEISTKIHITQSIHFIPTNEKNIGIDIGIGFNLR